MHTSSHASKQTQHNAEGSRVGRTWVVLLWLHHLLHFGWIGDRWSCGGVLSLPLGVEWGTEEVGSCLRVPWVFLRWALSCSIWGRCSLACWPSGGVAGVHSLRASSSQIVNPVWIQEGVAATSHGRLTVPTVLCEISSGSGALALAPCYFTDMLGAQLF